MGRETREVRCARFVGKLESCRSVTVQDGKYVVNEFLEICLTPLMGRHCPLHVIYTYILRCGAPRGSRVLVIKASDSGAAGIRRLTVLLLHAVILFEFDSGLNLGGALELF